MKQCYLPKQRKHISRSAKNLCILLAGWHHDVGGTWVERLLPPVSGLSILHTKTKNFYYMVITTNNNLLILYYNQK